MARGDLRLQARVDVAVGPLRLQVDLAADDGEVVALLGPNGAGKTTLLRVLAGLVAVDAGRVVLGDRVLDDPVADVFVSADRRPVGVVFQDDLLFPHLSALDNVAFGPRARGRRRREARVEAAAWLERVGLSDHAGVRPSALSGGQAQRVALARALVTTPLLLLLDEPMAALDVAARAEVRRELRRHLQSFRGVRLVVTHDPLEAAALADRLVVLERGRVVQEGSPADITARPRSRYAADLAGTNLYRGRAERGRVDLGGGHVMVTSRVATGDVFATVHPRAVSLHRVAPEGSPRNLWCGTVEAVDRLGDRVRVRVGGPVPVVAEVTAAAAAEMELTAGLPVWVAVKASEVEAYPA